MKIKKVLAFFFLCLAISTPSWAYWVWSPESGKFVNPEGAVQDTAEEQYDYAMQFYKEKNLDQAAEQLRHLLKKFPGARIASEAQYRLGTIYEEKADFMKAFQAYKSLVESYPQSERFNEVIEREFRIGNLFLSGKKAKFMGLEILPSLPRAAEVFQHIVKQAPFSDYGDNAQFRLGLTYKKWAHFDEAIEAFQAVIDQYPQSELQPEARFQLAETSFLRSAAENRDQRALDDAEGQVDRFLTRYSDTDATSEKAAKLRQEIDEKNAEKNYRIGLYYEKENYLESALIYYSDVAARYLHTRWGEKAAVKLKSLKEPADFLSSQEKEVQQEVQILEAKVKGLSEQTDPLEKDRMKRQLERLKQRQKSIEKNKVESLKRRRDDIKRREGELKEKFKKLEKKKKLFKNNSSEDFKRAMDRWTASLESERETLASERKQLKEWGTELGVVQRNSPLELLPFLKEAPSELDKVRRLEAKKLYKVAGEKKSLLEEKELLYKQYSEVSTLLKEMDEKKIGLEDQSGELAKWGKDGGGKLKSKQEKLEATRAEIKRLETELDQKRSLYEKKYGVPNWLGWAKAPTRFVTRSTTGVVTKSIDALSVINPFDAGQKPLEEKSLEELLERRMHLKEKIATQQNLTDTLSQALDKELALQEQKRLLASLESGEKTDPQVLRKSIKRLEKDIRSRYEEIADRHEHKKELLKQLDRLLKTERAEEKGLPAVGRVAAAPAIGAYKFGKAFLFGLPHEDVQLTKSAEGLPSDSAEAEAAKKLKDEIELESLLIETKSNEIPSLQKELEILRAKAALMGGFKFRSSIVKVPYLFIGEAIESANRLVPKKNREEMIVSKLDRETRQLEPLREELEKVEALVNQKSPQEKKEVMAASQSEESEEALPQIAESKVKAEPAEEGKPQTEPAPGEAAMKKEMQSLAETLEVREKSYERERTALETELHALKKESGVSVKPSKETEKQEKKLLAHGEKLRKELKEIQEDLTKLILKESDLENEESTILEKRVRKIDTVIQKVHSKALSQDLLTERDRIEERLTQLESRRSFLSKERERFQFSETGASSS